ncbi:MAG: hypothetical protein WKF89_02355 [Chitinophagaceae bacterium]
MRILILYIALVLLVATACSKDKFNTKPSLKLKSISSYTAGPSGSITFQFDFTDKEGDISNLLNVRKLRMNRRATTTLRDSFALAVPDFPKKPIGIIKVTMDYQNYLVSAVNPPAAGNPPRPENDTLVFKFSLKDKANNVSDTVTTERIVILR